METLNKKKVMKIFRKSCDPRQLDLVKLNGGWVKEKAVVCCTFKPLNKKNSSGLLTQHVDEPSDGKNPELGRPEEDQRVEAAVEEVQGGDQAQRLQDNKEVRLVASFQNTVQYN
jgi:hypothetical protein